MLEGGSIESQLQKFFTETQTGWNNFLKPANNATALFLELAVSAKPKNPKVGQATSNILKSKPGGKVFILISIHSVAGLRLRVM